RYVELAVSVDVPHGCAPRPGARGGGSNAPEGAVPVAEKQRIAPEDVPRGVVVRMDELVWARAGDVPRRFRGERAVAIPCEEFRHGRRRALECQVLVAILIEVRHEDV